MNMADEMHRSCRVHWCIGYVDHIVVPTFELRTRVKFNGRDPWRHSACLFVCLSVCLFVPELAAKRPGRSPRNFTYVPRTSLHCFWIAKIAVRYSVSMATAKNLIFRRQWLFQAPFSRQLIWNPQISPRYFSRTIITFRKSPFSARYPNKCGRRYAFSENQRFSALKRQNINFSSIASRLLQTALWCNDIKCTAGQALFTYKVWRRYFAPLLWQPWKTCHFLAKMHISNSCEKNFELERRELHH